MANIFPKEIVREHGVSVYKWETITENDVGIAVRAPNRSDKSVHVTGTFGSGNIPIEGSNLQDSPVYVTLNDQSDNALALTAAGISSIAENTLWIRPGTPTGTTVDIDVYILMGTSR